MNTDQFTLAASTATLADEPAAREHADVVEFRLDLAAEPLDALTAYDGELPILATNRAAWEGGGATDDSRRLEELTAATDVDAVEAIDVELAAIENASAESLCETARERGVAIVASAHDFEATPPRAELVRTLSRARSYADVAKLAVTATTRADTLALLSVTEQLTRQGQAVATMAMGEVGRHTRVVAPVYGSKIGYAPVDAASATAPGQFDLATLAALVEQVSPRPQSGPADEHP